MNNTKINLDTIMNKHDEHNKSNEPPEKKIGNANNKNIVNIWNKVLTKNKTTPSIIKQKWENNIMLEKTTWEKSNKKIVISLHDIQKNIEKEKEKNNENDKKIALKMEKKEKEKEKEKNNENKPKKELFSNYEASLTQEKDDIINKIKQFKKLPKTKPIFLNAIIVIAISWIWLLFYINPKNHSLENYKTNIINIIDKNNVLYKFWTINKNNNPTTIIYKKEKIRIWWLNFEIEIGIVNNNKIIKYNWKIYNSNEELEKDIKKEVEEIKKERLINELMKFF